MDTILMKYRDLENEYLVYDTNKYHADINGHAVRSICSQNCGMKSSAVVVGPYRNRDGQLDVKVFSPDGEEQSANVAAKNAGLRYLQDAGYLPENKADHFDAKAVGKVFLSGAFLSACHIGA